MKFHVSKVAGAALSALALLIAAPQAVAVTSLVTDDSGYTGPELDLSAFENGSYNFTFGPVALPGGITFTANPGGGGNSGNGSVIGQGGYGLSDNGSFGGDAVYIGVDSETGYAELVFDTLISSFGGYWNYSAPVSGDNPTISVFDDMGGLLNSFDLSAVAPISTPGGFNEFAFRGVVSDIADIKTVRFGGSYILLAGTADGAVPPPSSVPVPASGLLLIGALGSLVVLRRRNSS